MTKSQYQKNYGHDELAQLCADKDVEIEQLKNELTTVSKPVIIDDLSLSDVNKLNSKDKSVIT